MSEFQNFLDDALTNISFTNEMEEEQFVDYDVYSEISGQISLIRKNAKITQKELAEKCGLTQSNISNIEKGISKPTIDSLKKIADSLGRRLRIEFEEREVIS